jgi:hypothetical protein
MREGTNRFRERRAIRQVAERSGKQAIDYAEKEGKREKSRS